MSAKSKADPHGSLVRREESQVQRPNGGSGEPQRVRPRRFLLERSWNNPLTLAVLAFALATFFVQCPANSLSDEAFGGDKRHSIHHGGHHGSKGAILPEFEEDGKRESAKGPGGRNARQAGSGDEEAVAPRTSSLREHPADTVGLCTEPNPLLLHRVEKRSYLPPVTCTTLHETTAIQAKVHCQPRPQVVRLPWPNDTSVHQMTPSHVEVKRCDGSCFHSKQSCLPTKVRIKTVPVLLAQCTIHVGKCDKICANVEVDEHVECGCECKVKRHHCNTKQVYREELCGCQCRDLTEVRACHESGRVWDPSMCMCRCPLSTLQQCSTNFVFDFTNSCKCIPRERSAEDKEPGTMRTERSQPSSDSDSWVPFALAGFGLVVLLLALLAVSLARHNHRLQRRLRHSAEVLVPTGASIRIPAHA